MRIVLTGTPCTGKSAIARELSKKLGYRLIYLNEIVENKKLWKERDKFGSKLVRMDKLKREVNRIAAKEKNLLIEGHLACELRIKKIDLVIVCRTNPKTLKKRLRERGYPKGKIENNLMSELLDYCTILSLENYKRVYEIETSKRLNENINEILGIIKGRREDLRAGWVGWGKELREAAMKAK